ncbi:MAG: hypothetical protein OXG53_12385 [Chloroflexi bacterium]|nr:hypothetical protein [Chloroflexota bacterium]
MEHIWTLVCHITSEDKNTGAFSLINALERIEFSGDPAQLDADQFVVPLNYHLVTTWWCENPEECTESQIRVRLISPNNEDLGGPDLDVSFGDSQYSRFNLNLQGFPYKGDGVYRYVVSRVLGDEEVEVQRIPIAVERLPFEPPQN